MTLSYAHTDAPATEAPNIANNINQTIQQFSGFASLLRVFGILTIVAGMSLFLLQGWQAEDDISRYYMLLSQTVLLAAGGFALSFLLKENKGGRVFFGLALISVTVNMTTLGALIFSTTQWGSALVSYPDYARWQAMDSGTILLALAATLACSAPIVYFSHKVMARHSSHLLTAIFLGMNLLLLVPARESWPIGLVALAATLLPMWLIRRRLAEDLSLRTTEGFFAVATLLLPGAIIMFRSLWLYPADELLVLMLASAAYVSLRIIALHMDKELTAYRFLEALSVGAACGVALSFASLASDLLSHEMVVSLFAFIFSGLLLDMATRAQKPLNYIHCIFITLAACHLLPAIAGNGNYCGALCLLAGMAMLLLGYHYQIRRGVVLGGVTMALGAIIQFGEIFEVIDFSDWITLSITGATIITAASLIERHGAYLKLKWSQLEGVKR